MGCHCVVLAARILRGMRRSSFSGGHDDLVLECNGGVSRGRSRRRLGRMSMVGSPWRDVWRPAERSHLRARHAQRDSIHQHRIANVCERRITHRGCAPASHHGHDGRVGRTTSPPGDLRGVRTRERVSRETVGFLAGCRLSRLGSIWTGAGSLYARPTPFTRGIDAAALNRGAVVVFELRLRVKWSNLSEASEGRLRI